MSKKSRIITLISAAIAIFEVLSFVFAGLPNDVKTYYMGLAYSAKYSDLGEFVAVLKNWELKGFLSRYILWFPHKFASMFFEYQSLGYFRMYKVWYALILLFIVAIIVYIIKRKTENYEKAVITGLMVLSLFMVTVPEYHMQAEMSVAIMLVFAITIYSMCDSVIPIIFAGVVVGLTFFVKSSFLIMDIAVLGAVIYLSNNLKNEIKKISIAIGSCIITVGVVLLLLKLFYPQEITDALAVPAMYRTALAGNPLPIRSFIFRFLLEACYGVPFVMVGMIASVLSFVKNIRNKNWVADIGLVLMWLAPTITILISGRTNICYYNLYLVVAFVVLFRYIQNTNVDELQFTKKDIISVLACVLVCILINTDRFYSIFHEHEMVFCLIPVILAVVALFVGLLNNEKIEKFYWRIISICLIGLYISSISCVSIAYQNIRDLEKLNYENAHEITERFIEAADEIGPVLYLDDGLGLALLGCESYSRYFFPIPIQRVNLESESYTGEFKSELYNALGYEGEYILINEKWFYNFFENRAIREKIEQEYEVELTYTKYVFIRSVFCDEHFCVPVEYKLLKRK